MDNKLLIETLKNKKDTIIFFQADWCHACKSIRPLVMEISDRIGIDVFYVNEDEELEQKFNVQYYPTLVFVKDNSPRKYIGADKITILYENLTYSK
jgi:thiol-disulfide isomerase/thioredoxin